MKTFIPIIIPSDDIQISDTVTLVMAIICGVILFLGLLAWMPIIKGIYRLHYKSSKPIEHGYSYGKTFSLSEIRSEVAENIRTQFDLDYLPYVRIIYSRLTDDGIIAVLESDICGKIEYNNGKITFLTNGQ